MPTYLITVGMSIEHYGNHNYEIEAADEDAAEKEAIKKAKADHSDEYDTFDVDDIEEIEEEIDQDSGD